MKKIMHDSETFTICPCSLFGLELNPKNMNAFRHFSRTYWMGMTHTKTLYPHSTENHKEKPTYIHDSTRIRMFDQSLLSAPYGTGYASYD
jgi:hypothetical protein